MSTKLARGPFTWDPCQSIWPDGIVESAVLELRERSPSPRRHPHQQFKKAALVDLGKKATVV
ncbi:MAG TPA: hypothetical protein VIU11_06655, partial [Nakamurella sp.]